MFSDISCTVHTPKKAILKPEAILEKGDHEGGCDYGPSQTSTIWLSITHHHLPLNCCRFSGIKSQKLDISQFILILCSRFVRSSVFGLALDKSLVVFFLFPWSPFSVPVFFHCAWVLAAPLHLENSVSTSPPTLYRHCPTPFKTLQIPLYR